VLTISLLAASAIFQTTADPLLLHIGHTGVAQTVPGQLLDLRSERAATLADVVKAMEGKRYLFLGESHTNPDHHRFQADCIQALVKSGRPVAVGFEMFTRPAQPALNPWSLGWWTEQQFIEKSDWKHQWGFDYALYRPIFEVIRENRIPMVALNIPREWVRAVGKQGFTALSAEQRQALPPKLGTVNPLHRQIFNSMMGGHPMTGVNMEFMYDGQVLWDEAMADSALKYVTSRGTRDLAFVVIAGSGHVMYGQGINWRLQQRGAEPGVTVVMVDGEKPVSVSRGVGDFVYEH
jgi:uncharacterized iron-regulated protein